MVMVLPMYEIVQPGVYLQHRSGHRRRRHVPRQVPQAAHPPDQGLLGEVLLQARFGRVPGVRHRGRQGRRVHLLRPPLPEGWRALGLNGAEIVFNPSATHRGLSEYLWRIEQPAAAVANIYYVGAINRVGIEELGENDFYGQSYFVDPEGKFVGDVGDPYKPELIVRELDMDKIKEVRDRWAFYRDRSSGRLRRTRRRLRRGTHMARTLIKNGLVVSPTGTTAQDVLIDGEVVVALGSPGYFADAEQGCDKVIDAAGST